MLVLSRKTNEAIILTDSASGKVLAEVAINKSKHGRVSLAINAPLNIQIHRKENYDKLTKECPST